MRRPGETALVRFIRFGKVWVAMPHTVVRDSAELVVLHLPLGTLGKWYTWDGATPIRGQADRDWGICDHVWHTYRILTLVRPGDGYGLELLWRTDETFAGWYVNLQEPLRRTQLGFDTDDLVLDIWVDPDGSWRWKDEDELEIAVELGRFTPAQLAEIRSVGESVLATPPWPTGWEDWRPDPSWPLPALPDGWDVV
jgi:hypothetical protein